MSEELKLLPCPFCGIGGAKAGAHTGDCYFTVCAAITSAAPGDLSSVPDILAAWNRRAASTRTASDTRTAAGEAHPYHRDLEGLNEFISGFCQGDARLITCAQAAWYRCMDRNHALNSAGAAGEAECDAARRAAPAGQQERMRLDFPTLHPGCGCANCNPHMLGRMMFLCSICGNKRCPHATNHAMACTNSNEPGQHGSAYGNASTDTAAGPACQGGNTQPVSVESTRPAEVDVEAERRSARENLRASGKVPMVGWTLSDAYSEGWLAARTQADAGKAVALQIARAWIVDNRPAATLSRQATIDRYMAVLAEIDAATTPENT